MKKISIIVLAILIFSASVVQAKTFSDLPEEHWAYNAVDTMVKMKIINGYPDGTFLPEKLITKAEFAKILVETLKDEDVYEIIEYADVPHEFWAYNYINVAKQYFEPIPFETRNEFYPNKTLTREEVATIVVRTMKLDKSEYNIETLENIVDKDKIADDFKKYVAIAYENNFMQGNEEGAFNPKEELTRAQVCQLMNNIIEIEKEKQEMYGSFVGRWVPEKIYNQNGKKVSFEEVFGFEITDKIKLVLDNKSTFNDYFYSYDEEILNDLDYGLYEIVGNKILLKFSSYEFEKKEKLEIKQNNNSSYLIREITVKSENETGKKYKVYYRKQDKTEIITDVVELTSPKKDELIDETNFLVIVKYYDAIKDGKLKITNSKNERLEGEVMLNYSTIRTVIQCEPNETYTVTAYDVIDRNGYKFEDYTYEISVSNELANLGPQYRKYSSKKVQNKYKLEDYPLYEKELFNLSNNKNYKLEGYKLYDLDKDEEPELLIGIDGKIRAIYYIKDGVLVNTGIIGPAGIYAERYYKICENNVIIDYIEVLVNKEEPKQNFRRAYNYMYFSKNVEGFFEHIEYVSSIINDGKIEWKKSKAGDPLIYDVTKEDFYDTLDKYKILKIELDNYTIN